MTVTTNSYIYIPLDKSNIFVHKITTSPPPDLESDSIDSNGWYEGGVLPVSTDDNGLGEGWLVSNMFGHLMQVTLLIYQSPTFSLCDLTKKDTLFSCFHLMYLHQGTSEFATDMTDRMTHGANHVFTETALALDMTRVNYIKTNSYLTFSI